MPRPCLQCPADAKRLARSRGLCPTCYRRQLKGVRHGQTTWAELERQGLALPVEPRGAAWQRGWDRWRKSGCQPL